LKPEKTDNKDVIEDLQFNKVIGTGNHDIWAGFRGAIFGKTETPSRTIVHTTLILSSIRNLHSGFGSSVAANATPQTMRRIEKYGREISISASESSIPYSVRN
jgi:hypothetical protein